MPPSLQLPGLLHHNQVLTVKKAACWVQFLIDYYTQDVRKQEPFALEASAVQEYASALETLLWHAGVLEQLLCRMCLFLPDEVVQSVVAIVVATHHQLSLIESSCDGLFGECIVLDPSTLSGMSGYLNCVTSHLMSTNDWVRTEEYRRITRAVDEALAQLRDSLASFLAERDGSLPIAAPNFPSSSTQLPREGLGDHAASSSLGSLLTTLSDKRYSDTASIPLADWEVLKRNFTPLVFSNGDAYNPPDMYACVGSKELQERDSSPSTTAYSGSPRPSLKGKERCHSDTSIEARLSSSDGQTTRSPSPILSYLPPPLSSPKASLYPESIHQPQSRRKRPRSRSESPRPPKKRRVSIRVHGVDGCLSDCDPDVHDALVALVEPHVGASVPLQPGLSPWDLLPPPSPPPHLSAIHLNSTGSATSSSIYSPSPSPPPSSPIVATCNASPRRVPPPAPFRSTFPTPFAHLPIPLPSLLNTGSHVSSSSTLDDSDTRSEESDSLSYVTAPEDPSPELMELNEQHAAPSPPPAAPDAMMIDACPPRVPLSPAKRVEKRRRCFTNLLQTVKQFFSARSST
ncbi:hypothetical protein C8Q76DRAFT_763018 [Earliella scabrosa]|nr:hypothetical protein C8Q76DRAFT_763018 [Earliella scabrosa]